MRAPCETPRVFTSGHYDWRECPLNNRAKAHREFVRAHCLGTPGQRWAAWRAPHPYRTGGCRSRCQPKTYCLFDALDTHPESEPQAYVMIERNKRQPPALDLVKREFVAKNMSQLWVADMTYVPTWAESLHLAVVTTCLVAKWCVGPLATRCREIGYAPPWAR